MNPFASWSCSVGRAFLALVPALFVSGCSNPTTHSTSCRTVANCTLDSAPVCEAASLTCRACTMGVDDLACKNGRPSTPRCGPQGACVACMQNADCAARDLRKPACKNFACGPCKSPADCQSKLCSADGSCAPVEEVLYVDNKNGSCSGSSHKGSQEDPFCTLADAVAMSTSGGKTMISVAPSSQPYAALVFKPSGALQSLTVSGSGTKPSETRVEGVLDESAIDLIGDGAGGKPVVTVRNLELRGGSGANSAGLGCKNGATVSLHNVRLRSSGGCGARVQNCNITVESSELFDNHLCGITLTDSTFALSNVMLWSNRSTGISLGTGNTGTMRFLTLAANGSLTSTAPAGIDCGSTPHVVEHSIVFDNYSRASGTFGLDKQLVGCSLTNVVTNDSKTSGGVYKTALEFVTPSAPDIANIDLHLIKDSAVNKDACVDKVAQSPVDHDIDGTQRPQGAASDIGAHEVQ